MRILYEPYYGNGTSITNTQWLLSTSVLYETNGKQDKSNVIIGTGNVTVLDETGWTGFIKIRIYSMIGGN